MNFKKTIRTLIGAISMIVIPGIFPVTTAAQSEPTIVTYEGVSTKRPDFTGTVFAITFGGLLGEKASALAHKNWGVQRFSVGGSDPCNIHGPVICMWFGPPSPGIPLSGSSSSSYYGSRGGVSSWNSSSGEEYIITLHLDLRSVDWRGNPKPVIPLATITSGGFAGQTNDSVSSSDRHGSGYSEVTAQTPEQIAIGNAMEHAVSVLFSQNWFMRHLGNNFKDPNTTPVQWFPGATEEIREAFGR